MASFRICASATRYRILRGPLIGFPSPGYALTVNHRNYSNQNDKKYESGGSKLNKGLFTKLAALGVISLTIGNWQKYYFRREYSRSNDNLLFSFAFSSSVCIASPRLHEVAFPPIEADANANASVESDESEDQDDSDARDQQIKKKPKKEKVGFRDRKVSQSVGSRWL